MIPEEINNIIKNKDKYKILLKYDIYELYDFLDSYKKYNNMQKSHYDKYKEYEIIFRKHKDKYLIENNINTENIINNWYLFNIELNKLITR